jgi:Cytochrome P460
MVRDAERYKSTGGWGYEEFGGDSRTERRVGVLAATACYSCHAQQKENDNVFSKFRN